MKKEAMFFEKLEGMKVGCVLCPHNCVIENGKYGFCGVRKNDNGVLFTNNYGEITGFALDPIEKKPMFHLYPGKAILSLGTFGCNLNCPFCQNHNISYAFKDPSSVYNSSENIVEKALKMGSFGIAYTYNEPTVFYEFVFDTSRIAKEKGLKNILVTNGQINEGPLLKLMPFIDGANIDLKSFEKDFYERFVFGNLDTTLNTIKILHEHKKLIEITFLTITGHNDSKEETDEMAKWISVISKDIPLHLSRYYPVHKMKDPPTPIETMNRNYEIAKKYLNYVYLGNVADPQRTSTYCPSCKKMAIERNFYSVNNYLNGDKCLHCGNKIEGIYV